MFPSRPGQDHGTASQVRADLAAQPLVSQALVSQHDTSMQHLASGWRRLVSVQLIGVRLIGVR